MYVYIVDKEYTCKTDLQSQFVLIRVFSQVFYKKAYGNLVTSKTKYISVPPLNLTHIQTRDELHVHRQPQNFYGA